MEYTFTAESIEELPQVASEVKKLWKQPVLLLQGQMGAGKTTFTRALLKEMGITDEVSSPTYSLVNEYMAGDGSPVFHFDFYRLKDISEAYDMGAEDYFYSQNHCIIEWPDIIMDMLPPQHQTLSIEVLDDVRIFRLTE